MEVLRRGSRARQKAATALNTASSRSHSIYSIVVSQQVPTCPAHHLYIPRLSPPQILHCNSELAGNQLSGLKQRQGGLTAYRRCFTLDTRF